MDGNSATFYGDGSCTHTKNDEDKAWWRVDLGKEERVSEVYIVNRDRGNKLENFQIRVGRLPFALYIQMYKDHRCSVFIAPITCKKRTTNSSVIKCRVLFE